LESKDRQRTWYIARHLKQLSGDLATWGFAEAALLVGAAAISVGDEAVRLGNPSGSREPVEKTVFHRSGGARHG
jgi:hypothetical protein